MQKLVDSLGESIVIIEKNGDISYCNTAFFSLFGVQCGDSVKSIFKHDDRDIFFRNLLYLVEKNKKYNNFIRLISKDNGLVFCWINVFELKNEIVFEIFDLTKVEKIDSNINNKAYAKLLKYMSEGVAHSIRNPIMSAGGMLNRLKSKLSEDEKKKMLPYIEVVEKSLYRIMSIIADIEVISSSLPATLKKIDLKSTIESIVKKYSDRENIKFNLKIEDGVEIYADSMHISFVVEEILKNSLDAIGEDNGSIDIEIKKNDNDILIIISDNGKGIDEEQIPLVMIPFYSTKPSNMGIGLSLTKFIIEGYKGELALYSKKGEGTKVIVSLPIEKRAKIRKELIHDKTE